MCSKILPYPSNFYVVFVTVFFSVFLQRLTLWFSEFQICDLFVIYFFYLCHLKTECFFRKAKVIPQHCWFMPQNSLRAKLVELGRLVNNHTAWLVVEPTPLKNMSQNGNLPQIEVKIQHIWNHHLAACIQLIIFDVPPIRWQSPPKTITSLVEDPKLNHKFQVSLGRRSIPDNIPYHLHPLFRVRSWKMTFDTVDGSEIPRPTTWYIYIPLQIMGSTTNLNWLYSRISEPSTVSLDIEGDTSGGHWIW